MSEDAEGKNEAAIADGTQNSPETDMAGGMEDLVLKLGSRALLFGSDLAHWFAEKLGRKDGSSEGGQSATQMSPTAEVEHGERRQRLESVIHESKRRALVMDPMHGMTEAQYRQFKLKAVDSGDYQKTRADALTEEFLSADKRRPVPPELVRTNLRTLKEDHAKTEWGYEGPALGNWEFLKRARAHYDLQNKIATAGGFAALFQLDPATAREAALHYLISTDHPGLNLKRMDGYLDWFDQSMDAMGGLVREVGVEAHRVLPSIRFDELFAPPPDPEIALNGNIVSKRGRGGETRVLALAEPDRYRIADPRAPLSKLMKASKGVPLYFPQTTPRATIEDKDPSEREPHFLEGFLKRVLPSVPQEPLKKSLGLWQAYTDQQQQRQTDEQNLLETADKLAVAYGALESSFQASYERIGRLTDENVKRFVIRDFGLKEGRKRVELADQRSGLLWEAWEQMRSGGISVQTYHEVGRKLGVWNVLEGPTDKAYDDDSWENGHSHMARLRAEPGMGDFANQLETLRATYRERMIPLLPALKRKEPEALAKARDYEKDYRFEQNRILSVMGEKRKKIWDLMGDFIDLTYGETFIPVPDNIEGVNYQEWQAQNQAERLRKMAALGREMGLSDQESQRTVDTILLLQRTWSSAAPGLEPDKTRILPDGRILVNPKFLVIPEEYKEAVMSAKASSVAKRQAMEMYPELQKKAARDLHEALKPLRNAPEIEALYDAHPGTPEEQAAGIARDLKGKVLQQAINRLKAGGTGLAQQGAGVLALLTGVIEEHTDASVGADYMHDTMMYWQNLSSARERLAQLGDTGPLADSFTKLLGASVSVVPPLVAGGGVLLATRPFMAARGLQMTAMFTAAATAGAQSAASVYGDGYAIHLSSGLPELEARQKALDPALRAGLITAAVTYAGGPRGVEAFFRQAEGRELVKRTLWERGRAFGIHFKAEGLEESTDTFLQALNEMISHNPGKPLEEVMKETWNSFWIGGALGGTMGVIAGGRGKRTGNREGGGANGDTAPSAGVSNAGEMSGNPEVDGKLTTEPEVPTPLPSKPTAETEDAMDRLANERREALESAQARAKDLSKSLNTTAAVPRLSEKDLTAEAAKGGTEGQAAEERLDELRKLEEQAEALPPKERAEGFRKYEMEKERLLAEWTASESSTQRARKHVEQMLEIYGDLNPAVRHEVGRPPEVTGEKSVPKIKDWLGKVQSAAGASLAGSHFDAIAEVDADMRLRGTEEERQAWIAKAREIAGMDGEQLTAAYANVRAALNGDVNANPEGLTREQLQVQERLLDTFGGTREGATGADNHLLDSESGIRDLSETARSHINTRRGGTEVRPETEHKLRGDRWSVGSGTVNATVELEQITSHPDYLRARGGDAGAARRVVSSKVDAAKIRESAKRHPDAHVVVMPGEQSHRLPGTLSVAYANEMLAGTSRTPHQGITLRAGRLGNNASEMKSMALRPKFQGEVKKGGQYILVADEVGDGVAFAEMRHYIQRHGGIVVEMHAVGGPATTDISIKPQTKHALVSKFGSKKGINVTLRANGFYGGSIDALTEAEAQRMLQFDSDKDLEDALQIEIEKELPPNKDPNLDDRQYVRKARGLVWWEKLSAANENAISTYRRGLKDRNKSVRNVLLIEGTLNGEKLSIETPSGEKYAKGIRSPRNYETVEVGHDRRFDSELMPWNP